MLDENKIGFKEMATLKSNLSLDFQLLKYLDLSKFEAIMNKVLSKESKQAGAFDIIKSVCMGDPPND